MTTTHQNFSFGLSDGFMEISNGNVIITDKAKMDSILELISSVAYVLFALSSIYKWTRTADTFDLVIGSIILVTSIAMLWKWYKESRFVENNIKLSDIVTFKLVNIKLSDSKVGLIQTKNNKVRRIKMEYNNFVEIGMFMEANNIEVIS